MDNKKFHSCGEEGKPLRGPPAGGGSISADLRLCTPTSTLETRGQQNYNAKKDRRQ